MVLWFGDGIAVVRIPRGFDRMKAYRVGMWRSAWAARRYIVAKILFGNWSKT